MRNFEPPPPMDPRMQAIIEAARGGHEPNELNRARVRRGVDLKLAAGLGVAFGPATSALAGAAVKVTLAVAVVGTAVGAGIYALPHHVDTPARPAAPVVHRHAPAPAVTQEQEAPPAPVAVAPVPTPAPRRRFHAAPSAPPVESASAIAEETALLSAANSALAHHDVDRALSLLNNYDHHAGAGILAEERTVTGVLALCAAGKTDAAAVEARRFRARWSRSPLAARIDGSCVGPAPAGRSEP